MVLGFPKWCTGLAESLTSATANALDLNVGMQSRIKRIHITPVSHVLEGAAGRCRNGQRGPPHLRNTPCIGVWAPAAARCRPEGPICVIRARSALRLCCKPAQEPMPPAPHGHIAAIPLRARRAPCMWLACLAREGDCLVISPLYCSIQPASWLSPIVSGQSSPRPAE